MLPTLGLMLHTTIDQRSQAADDVEHNALRLARLVVRNNDQLIESTHQLLIVLAQMPQVRNGSSAECRALVVGILKGFPTDVSLEAVNLNGDVFCSTLSSNTTFNVGDRNYFQRALQTRAFAIGDYATSRTTGNPSVDVAFPILEAGAVQGVVVAGIDLP